MTIVSPPSGSSKRATDPMIGALAPIQRCCESHENWATLTEHLCRDFPTIPRENIVRGLLEAQAAAEGFELDPTDALDTVELMTRYRLMLMTGEVSDGARTDPQPHQAARSTRTD